MRISISEELVERFAECTGDYSSLHVDAEFARTTRFRKPIAHGMLPLAALFFQSLWAPGAGAQMALLRLASLKVRFRDFFSIGDLLFLQTKVSDGGNDHIRVGFTFSKNGLHGSRAVEAVATFQSRGIGKVALTEVPVTSGGFFPVTVVEGRHSVASLFVGLSEELNYMPGPEVLRAFLGSFARQSGLKYDDLGELDPNLAAIFPISTLIGMRVPGRNAVFSGFSLKFERDIAACSQVKLRGEVADIFMETAQAKIDFSLCQSGEVAAQGTASFSVGTAAPKEITCSEIRARFVDLGVAGRVALVTGASRGIGAATAKLLSLNGAKVAVHYFRGTADAKRIVEDIRGSGGIAHAVQCDLRVEADVKGMFEEIEREFGGVDILVNNAVGEFSAKAIEGIEASDFLNEIEVSLLGMHACCRAAMGHMRKEHRGKIINLGTIATEMPVSGQSRYITAKSAVVGYSRSLALELARDNIQVNLVLPGMTETSLLASLPPIIAEQAREEAPSGKLLQPIDVAMAILFLVSDWAGAISGQKLVLNQGALPYL